MSIPKLFTYLMREGTKDMSCVYFGYCKIHFMSFERCILSFKNENLWELYLFLHKLSRLNTYSSRKNAQNFLTIHIPVIWKTVFSPSDRTFRMKAAGSTVGAGGKTGSNFV